MPTRLWRFLALAGTLFALGFVVVETADLAIYTDEHIAYAPAAGHSNARLRVLSVTGTVTENGGLRPGDIITPVPRMTARQSAGDEPAGTMERWIVQRGAATFAATTIVAASTPDEIALVEVFNVVRFAMILVALVVAVRRPDLPAARALVTFLVTLALTLVGSAAWLPDPALTVWLAVRGPIDIYCLSQGLLYACIFPSASERGPRAWIGRINPWYTAVSASAAFALAVWRQTANGLPDLGPLTDIVAWSPMAYFAGFVIAFWIAAAQSSGRDRQRVHWAARSIGVGFTGPLIATVLRFAFNRTESWIDFLALSLIAMPFGMAYTILRHRTIDIGFVISRALVLTILSALIVVAFGLLERALGKIFIDASHIGSRSVEIALALGLGFSLRSLHARVERIIDRVFFRHRQRALAALKAFATDVYFITDPDVALERTVDVVHRCADAGDVALYLIADGVFGCAAAIDPAGFPAEVSENDPLFVRMRASRQAEFPREVASGLDAEIAFPMFVRAALVGALVLGPKRTGEAYDPEETALLADIAGRVGLALDALQTAAMRRELESLLGATSGAAPAL